MADEDTQSEAPVKAPPVKEPAAKGKPAKGKGKDGKKDKKATVVAADGPTVAGHPRAARAVARAKGWGALGGFLFGGYVSLPTGTLAEAGLRALVSGAVCYVAVWAGAVFVWRRLVVLEIKAREQQLVSALVAAHARRELTGPGAGVGDSANARAS